MQKQSNHNTLTSSRALAEPFHDAYPSMIPEPFNDIYPGIITDTSHFLLASFGVEAPFSVKLNRRIQLGSRTNVLYA